MIWTVPKSAKRTRVLPLLSKAAIPLFYACMRHFVLMYAPTTYKDGMIRPIALYKA